MKQKFLPVETVVSSRQYCKIVWRTLINYPFNVKLFLSSLWLKGLILFLSIMPKFIIELFFSSISDR